MKELTLTTKTIWTESGKPIFLYLLPEEQLDTLTEEDRSVLHPHYLEKMAARKQPESKRHALASGYLLWKVLGVTPEDEIVFSEKEKPSFPGHPEQFSLSHDDGVTVLAVAEDAVGVDVEKRTPNDPRVVQKVFPEAYRDYITAAREAAGAKEDAADAESAAFTECWTKLEAILKAEGCGLHRMLQDSDLETWTVQTFPWNGYVISVAYR